MFGPTGLAVGPVMLPTCSAKPPPRRPEASVSDKSSTGGSVSHASSQAGSKSQDESRPTSSELDLGEDSRNPFIDKMMTQTNLLVLPPSNPSYQMAYFLKTTGPVKEPAIKGTKSKRISSAMRIFKNSSRRSSESLAAAHRRLNEVISEENDDLEQDTKPPGPAKQDSEAPKLRLPETVVPKVSKTGKKYLEIEPVDTKGASSEALNLSSEIIESRVSVLVTDQLSTDSLHDWVLQFEASQDDSGPKDRDKEASRGRTRARTSVALSDEETIRMLDAKTVTPVRPLFLGTKAPPEIPDGDKHVLVIRGKMAPLRSHPITPGPAPSIAPPALPGSRESLAVTKPIKSLHLAHPSPRRPHGHPLVLQRTSSDVSGMRFSGISQDDARSVSDSPGPPPPRSPLRVSMQSESLDKILSKSSTSVDAATYDTVSVAVKEGQAIRVTKEAAVTYVPREKRDDDLPSFLRPGSSATNTTTSDVFCSNANKSKAGSSKPLELIDAMVKASQQNTSRRRLRRTRPEGPRPLDLSSTRSRGSPERDQKSEAYCTSPLSVKRTASTSDMSENYRIISATASPSPRISHVRKAHTTKGRSPAPRSKTAKRGRSMKSVTSTPSRVGSPAKKTRQSATPDLPSPPPKKELPPTPREKSHRLSRSNYSEGSIEAAMVRASSTKDLPVPPIDSKGRSMVFPSPPSSAKITRSKMHVGEQSLSTLEARLDSLERENRLLNAALMAVLKTGGTLNGCPCHADSRECPDATRGGGLVAHGSVRSRVSSVESEPSALNVYLSTRGK